MGETGRKKATRALKPVTAAGCGPSPKSPAERPGQTPGGVQADVMQEVCVLHGAGTRHSVCPPTSRSSLGCDSSYNSPLGPG